MREIDGAKTLLIAPPENGEFGFIGHSLDGMPHKVEYLSINQYENDNRFYLFLLDEQFETLTDYIGDSIDELKEEANKLFPDIKNIDWRFLK